jgi:hypothetical protein
MNHDAIYAVLGAIIVAVPVVVFQARRINDLKLKAARTKQRDELLFAQYKLLVGWSIGQGSYHYISLDGGRHWYATEKSGGGRRIIGDVDPQRVDEILGLQTLIDDVRKNGPIDLGDPARTSKLTQAGFDITND